MISMTMVCSVQTVHLSCTDINIVSKWTKMKFHTTHATYEFHWVRPQLFMSLWYPRHLGIPLGAFKMIYEPMVHLTQIEHLSWTDANTVSKLIETRFHKTHVN
jgi:hypothetical protein